MALIDQTLPTLSDTLIPPIVLGTADLTSFAYQGNDHAALMRRIEASTAPNPAAARPAAYTYDAAIALQLAFRRAQGLDLQDTALDASPLWRITGAPDNALRLLALVGPGDLMTNTPLDFLTNHLDVRLDLLYLLPDRPLPAAIPDHDVAFFAQGEADPATLARLRHLFAAWPRPALNDPRFLPSLQRDTLSRSLAGIPTIASPTAVATSRTELQAHLDTGRPIPGFDSQTGPYPCLIRPTGSHAGAGLSRLTSPAELAHYLRFCFDRQFFLTAFHDYQGSDGLYRKSRVGFIDRQPFLCHMAISQNWMVHYLNADMTESAAKRAEEAAAMAAFDNGFARRHASAFAALHERLGFDFYSIDCAETRDGRLLVFEADAAAIIHLMDPPDLFPYKQPQMHKVFAAFEAMLRRRAGPPRSGAHHTAASHTAASHTAASHTAAFQTPAFQTARSQAAACQTEACQAAACQTEACQTEACQTEACQTAPTTSAATNPQGNAPTAIDPAPTTPPATAPSSPITSSTTAPPTTAPSPATPSPNTPSPNTPTWTRPAATKPATPAATRPTAAPAPAA